MTTMEAAATANLTLTAEEAGTQFLKLIKGLRSRDDITVERVQEVMHLSLTQGPNGPFYSQPIGDDWFYVISIIPEAPGRKKGVMLEFLNRADRHADTSSSCGLNFENFHTALKQMGYEESLQHDEIGRLTHITYSKGDLLVGLTPELKVFPDGKAYPACVRRIGL